MIDDRMRRLMRVAKRYRTALLAMAVLALVWAGLVVLTGGVVVPLGFTVFRSRSTTRALAAGAALFAAYAYADVPSFLADVRCATEALRRAAPILAIAAALLLGTHALYFGTFVAGGADSYGYVSEAYLWAAGKLPASQPLLMTLPVGLPDLVQIPLGYRLGVHPHTMVPTYAPGLPFLMAVSTILGACGPFLVVPVAAAAFVLATYALGRRVAGPLIGLLAAALLTTSPALLYQSEWPMSDVPAGAVWTAALWAVLGGTEASAVAGGAFTALGLLIRPNLLPLVAVPLACVVLRAHTRRDRVRRSIWFVIPITAVVVVIASLNTAWYGAPWLSGYGSNADLYSAGAIWPNLRHYTAWLWESESPIILCAVVPFVPIVGVTRDRFRIMAAAMLALGTLGCYLAYGEYEAWWYLRFLLPGLGALFVVTAAGLVGIGRRLGTPWGQIAVAVVLVWSAAYQYQFSAAHGVFGVLGGEKRYVAAARYAGSLSANSVFFTMQHSGTVPFYGGRYSLRYDFLEPEWTRRAVPELEKIGYHPYLLIDDWEIEWVQRRFGFQRKARLPWPLIAHLDQDGGVGVYDMATRPAETTPVAIDPNPGPLCTRPLPIELRPAAP